MSQRATSGLRGQQTGQQARMRAPFLLVHQFRACAGSCQHAWANLSQARLQDLRPRSPSPGTPLTRARGNPTHASVSSREVDLADRVHPALGPVDRTGRRGGGWCRQHDPPRAIARANVRCQRDLTKARCQGNFPCQAGFPKKGGTRIAGQEVARLARDRRRCGGLRRRRGGRGRGADGQLRPDLGCLVVAGRAGRRPLWPQLRSTVLGSAGSPRAVVSARPARA